MFGDTGVRGFAALLAATALMGGLGCSDPAPSDPNAAIREIYYLSDLPGQVQPMAGYVEIALNQQRKEFTPEQLKIASWTVREVLSAERLEKKVLDELEEQTEREPLDAALEWLRTPLVKKIMQTRIAASGPAGTAEMKFFIEKLRTNPPSEKRVKLVERYDQAGRVSILAIETMLLSGYAVAVMYDALKPAEEREGPAALRESMKSQRALLIPVFKETAALTSLFVFRDISDEELESFVLASEGEVGKWYYATIWSVFLNAVLDFTANLGDVFVKTLESQPAS